MPVCIRISKFMVLGIDKANGEIQGSVGWQFNHTFGRGDPGHAVRDGQHLTGL